MEKTFHKLSPCIEELVLEVPEEYRRLVTVTNQQGHGDDAHSLPMDNCVLALEPKSLSGDNRVVCEGIGSKSKKRRETLTKRTPVVIESYRNEDEARCLGFLKQVFGDDSVSQTYFRFGESHTFLVILDGVLVGLVSAWQNSIHPFSLRSGIAVLPLYRHRGIGEMLWERLWQNSGAALPLITSLWETQSEGYHFALQHGFAEIRRTYTTELQVETVDVSVLDSVYGGMFKNGYRIVSYADADDGERTKMAVVLQQVYRATHTVNPPAAFSPLDWRALAFPADLLHWGSFAVMHGDECVAMALLHHGTRNGYVERGWRGVAESHQHLARALMVVTATRQIAEAASRGIPHISLECDSTDPWSGYVRETFPFMHPKISQVGGPK